MKRILIVDDERLIGTSLRRSLRDICDDVRFVDSGEEALTEVNSCFYDLCITDINLPGINGFELMRRIKGLQPETRFIVMTGSEIDGTMIRAIEEIADYFITKPFNISQVRTLVRQILSGDGSQSTTHNFSWSEGIRERRQSGRELLKKPFCFSLISRNREGLHSMDLDGEVTDISDGGIGLYTGYPLTPGCIIKLKGGPGEVTGIVRWYKHIEDMNRYRVGVQFIPGNA